MKLAFNLVCAEWEVDGWKAVCIVGPRALVEIKRGKIVTCGVFFNGLIREVKTGSNENLGGPWTAMSKGWKLCE